MAIWKGQGRFERHADDVPLTHARGRERINKPDPEPAGDEAREEGRILHLEDEAGLNPGPGERLVGETPAHRIGGERDQPLALKVLRRGTGAGGLAVVGRHKQLERHAADDIKVAAARPPRLHLMFFRP
jgi:hypothetical protein